MRTEWIEQRGRLAAFLAEGAGGALAVDTESNHFHAYRARVCLIQLAHSAGVALVDPLSIPADGLEPLFDRLEDESTTKVLHAARNDIIEFNRDWGVSLRNVFDTRTAARFLGYRRNSLDWLLEEVIGAESTGSFGRFDWTRRPIPDDARHYAAMDVAHLLHLQERFEAELDESGWLSPFRQQCAHVTRTTEYNANGFDPEGWRQIKQGRDLDGPGRGALRALYQWRHEVCVEQNRSALHVFNNRALVRVARQRPDDAQQLKEIKGVPDQLVSRRSDEILAALARAARRDSPQPNRRSRSGRRKTELESRRYDALRDWRNRTSEGFDLPPEFIATNATLADIAADPPDGVEDLGRFDDLLEWHRNMLGPQILEVLDDIDN
jgi:ribonuclease D